MKSAVSLHLQAAAIPVHCLCYAVFNAGHLLQLLSLLLRICSHAAHDLMLAAIECRRRDRYDQHTCGCHAVKFLSLLLVHPALLLPNDGANYNCDVLSGVSCWYL